ncbi:DUF3109 domain-containing protein [Brevibacillus sp. SYP-B805]|uniref:DUF3109 domain-containing protein n=1 Tax=Brevibacillus sp. SYP-B805 TaxID=1578199 RepID=UPI0013EAD313|nr:DUF3109 domain-containing protein [Brevibacillus sp. SYP-B805]NGQ97116.1 DUF3109 domain-containing protein [Brevibacillus sp. SYP-B805]
MKKGSCRYYGTPEPMGEKEAYHCMKYVKRRKADLVRYGSFLIDREALRTPLHLDCLHCRQVHGMTCCEGGQPYAVDAWQIPFIDREAAAVLTGYLDPGRIARAEKHGIWEQGNRLGSIPLHEGSCYYCTAINGSRGCALHAHAEATGQDLYALKPLSCQLYPLEMIEMGDRVLITAVTAQTATFSRWGTDYLEQFYCASLPRRLAAAHLADDLFAVEGYRPAYLWGLRLIQDAFGEQTADAVREICAG